MRPPTLRITTTSPGARPNTPTQPIIIVFSDGMIFGSAEKRLLAKVSRSEIVTVLKHVSSSWVFAG
jgi:hypothetical protein